MPRVEKLSDEYPEVRPRVHGEVVVVGAGPTGLLLAGDLAAAGVDVVVLEKRQGQSNLTRAFAVHARTLEHLDYRGLADRLVATGHRVDRLRLFGAVSLWLNSIPSRRNYLLVTPQYEVERLLLERAERCGAQVWRGVSVTGIRQNDAGVEVEAVEADGDESTLHARYVIGTDGHHSTVRDALGLDFPGRAVVRSLMLADVRLAEPPADLLTVVSNDEGFCFVVPYGDGWFRIIARDPRHELPDDAPIDLEDLRSVCQRVLGTDLGMHSPRWMSRFHSEERQARYYRVGRIFLAGDAAHVHSPAGGLGMNTGLQDAANLGWKLAAVIDGRVDDSILDSYQSERHPIGEAALRTSGGLVRAAMLRGAVRRRARDLLFRTGLGIGAVSSRAALRISGIGLRYPASKGAPDRVGMRAPDLRDAEGRGLHESLPDGEFMLVAPEVVGRRYATSGLSTFAPVDAAQEAMLVRPDGHIAWCGADGPGLRNELVAWGVVPLPEALSA